MIKLWWQFMQRPEVRRHAIFITDYDILVAEKLVEGVDVWLNNPERPWEASGTSGMKILVNGGLNLSELDGWWAEAYSPGVGWALGDGKEHNGDPVWNAEEANQLYDILEYQVIPEFYTRNENGIPLDWVSKMRESMAQLTPFFSTNRMVREYVEKYYLPLAENYYARTNKDNPIASEINSWQHNIDSYWNLIHLGEANITSTEEYHCYWVPVCLGELTPQQIRVELFAEALNDSEPVCLLMKQERKLCGTSNGFVYSVEIPNDRPPDHYTVRLIPYHLGVSVPLEPHHILWQR
jgi:starch phosphorylase